MEPNNLAIFGHFPTRLFSTHQNIDVLTTAKPSSSFSTKIMEMGNKNQLATINNVLALQNKNQFSKKLRGNIRKAWHPACVSRNILADFVYVARRAVLVQRHMNHSVSTTGIKISYFCILEKKERKKLFLNLA